MPVSDEAGYASQLSIYVLFLVLVSPDLCFDFLTASVYGPVTLPEFLFLLENVEE